MTLPEIIAEMQAAVDARRDTLAPPTGMRVPYLGPLASAVPSVLRDVQWWIDRLREVERGP